MTKSSTMRLFLRLSCVPPLLGSLLLALLCVTMAGGGGTQAATLIVTTTADHGVGSLRAAIAAANDGDTIQFDPALNGQTIVLTSGELAISKNITVNGPGANLLTVSRASTAARFRVFDIISGHTVMIAGLTI